MADYVLQSASQGREEHEYPVKQVYHVWGETGVDLRPFRPELYIWKCVFWGGKGRERGGEGGRGGREEGRKGGWEGGRVRKEGGMNVLYGSEGVYNTCNSLHHMLTQAMRQGKVKQLHPKTTPFRKRKHELPQAGFEPAILGRRSTN